MDRNAQQTFSSYVIGYVLSICLTIGAFLLVTHHSLAQKLIIGSIMMLAVIQLAVQLIFFLHLHREDKPRWNLRVFMFMSMVVLILVIGSLWIMYNLNYHHVNSLTPTQVNSYLNSQDGI